MFKLDEDIAPPPMQRGESFNVLTSPYWIGVFILVAMPFFVVFFFIGSFFELQGVSHEQRYAVYALLAGICSDIFLRRWLYVALAIVRNPRIPMILIWIIGCLAVLAFQPIKNFSVWF
ncbi:MAG: hypothetical protein IIB64_05170 [Proteobacteria bacterium]|nr:hypothetical protein [Pseudomonadota bacterium]